MKVLTYGEIMDGGASVFHSVAKLDGQHLCITFEGVIRIDGVDVRSMRLDDVYSRIGYVPQRGILFSGTIESNVRYGAPEAPQEAVERAVAIAQAAEFVDSAAGGYVSPISQRGTNVSGGQCRPTSSTCVPRGAPRRRGETISISLRMGTTLDSDNSSTDATLRIVARGCLRLLARRSWTPTTGEESGKARCMLARLRRAAGTRFPG